MKLINISKHFIHRLSAPLICSISFFVYKNSKKYRVFLLLKKIMDTILLTKPLIIYDIISNELYSKINKSIYSEAIITDRQGYTSDLIFNIEENKIRLIPVKLNDIKLYEYKDILIQGNSDFLIDLRNRIVINDFSYNIDPNYLNVDGILFAQKGNTVLLRYDGRSIDKKLKEGIMLSGKFCQNYYHQMYEIMIKLLIINELKIPYNIPLIVDKLILEVNSFRQILETLNIYNRKIEYIGSKEIINFDKLYYISSVNFIPPNVKKIKNIISHDIKFDLFYIKQMRDNLIKMKSEEVFAKKIFISRKCTENRKYNEDEVILLMEKYGFSVVYPEVLNLRDQISLFNGADIIVGASGAAFTNILFCKKGCKIICLQPRRLNIAAFSTIAYSLGVELRYCLGFAKGNSLHSSFRVNLTLLRDILSTLRIS